MEDAGCAVGESIGPELKRHLPLLSQKTIHHQFIWTLIFGPTPYSVQSWLLLGFPWLECELRLALICQGISDSISLRET